MTESERISLTLSFRRLEDSGWFEVRIEEFPEVFTAAPTRNEARVAALDALAQYLATFDDDEHVPTATNGREAVA
jgi:predicted RNase H-like HicB family nuclease